MTTVHWHGMHVPAEMDGTPHQQIEPGASWTAHYVVDQPAATMWYHPHPHERTGRQAYQGLAGLLLINDDVSDALDLPRTYGVDDVPLVIQDRRFDDDGQLEFRLGRGAAYGDEILINGTWNPRISVEGRLIRLRLLNGSNARIYYLGFDDEREFHQIASDGGLLTAPVKTNRVRLAPGERAELLVDFSDRRECVLKSFPEAGLLEVLESYFDGVGSGHFQLLKFQPVEPSRASHAVPESLASIARLTEADADVTRDMILGGPPNAPGAGGRGGPRGPGRGPGQGGPGQAGPPINGKLMDMSRIDERVTLGDTEIWRIHNRTGQPHPFHVHLVQFQVLDRDGRPPSAAEAGLKDTVLVHPGETVRIIMPFTKYANPRVPYMYHCHIMEHEDAGMMGQFLVVEEPDDLPSLTGKPTVMLFIIGLHCAHCYEQVQTFAKEFSSEDVRLAVVLPQGGVEESQAAELGRHILFLSDPDGMWAGWYGLISHESAVNEHADIHATLVLDADAKCSWMNRDQDAFMDVDEVRRQLKLLREPDSQLAPRRLHDGRKRPIRFDL